MLQNVESYTVEIIYTLVRLKTRFVQYAPNGVILQNFVDLQMSIT